MVTLECGRVCLKIAGREAGKYCAVIKPAGKSKEEKSFVVVTGPKLLTGVKRRRCNIEHLEATEHLLEVKEDATDEEVIAAYDKAGLITKFKLKKPPAAKLKEVKEKEVKEKKEVEKEKAEEKKKPKKKPEKKPAEKKEKAKEEAKEEKKAKKGKRFKVKFKFG